MYMHLLLLHYARPLKFIIRMVSVAFKCLWCLIIFLFVGLRGKTFYTFRLGHKAFLKNHSLIDLISPQEYIYIKVICRESSGSDQILWESLGDQRKFHGKVLLDRSFKLV